MTAIQVLLLLLHLGIVAIQVRADRGRFGHVLTFYAIGFVGFYLIRPIVLGLGADTPIVPLADHEVDRLVEDSLLYLLAWQVLVLGGIVVTRGRRAPRFVIGSVPPRLAARFGPPTLALLFAVSVLIVAFLAIRSGGLAETIVASKIDKEFVGLFYLQYVPIAGVLLAAQMAIDARRPARSAVLWLVSLTFALSVLAWGSRRVVVVVVAIAIVHRAKRIDSKRLDVRRIAFFGTVGAVAASAAALVLRVVRETAIGGASATQTTDQPLVRQLSLAMNSSYFEAFVLTVRDFPDRYPYWGLRPFVDGLAGVVPRALWPGKPAGVAVGASFRQIYEPSAANGWPIGGAGEWYLGFGLAGLVVGALVTGAVLAVVGRAMAKRGSLPYAAAMGLQVLELGFNGQSVLRWVGWVLPATLLTVVFVSASRRTSGSPTRSGYREPIPASPTSAGLEVPGARAEPAVVP